MTSPVGFEKCDVSDVIFSARVSSKDKMTSPEPHSPACSRPPQLKSKAEGVSEISPNDSANAPPSNPNRRKEDKQHDHAEMV